ncbi:hypothetical protein J6590_016038 [Homalodisca vitripennis]|nr:hypothetical protein J6590_016038 [Homalodisca vitripennis]
MRIAQGQYRLADRGRKWGGEALPEVAPIVAMYAAATVIYGEQVVGYFRHPVG